MRVIIDTNIFIEREKNTIIPEILQQLVKTLQKCNAKVLVHPASIEDINRDKDQSRKSVNLSKIGAYLPLENPPDPSKDSRFEKIVGPPGRPNDQVDNALIFSVYKSAVDFLVTEDQGILKRAEKLGIGDRVFTIAEANEFLEKNVLEKPISQPPALKLEKIHNLNKTDPIFNPLKKDYLGFDKWWEKISKEGREALIYNKNNNELGAILIHKLENEPISSTPPFPAKRRVKICTFKVDYTGFKIGELFLKKSIEYAIINKIEEIYLTHFPQMDDQLVDLISHYGFEKVAEKNGEDIYLKHLHSPSKGRLEPEKIGEKFYPSFYDGPKIKKFIVPIQPRYHQRLFPELTIQDQQFDLFKSEELIVEGNTIKKAYLCQSKTKKLSPGDILLFYLSKTIKAVTTIGVIETVAPDLVNPEEILRIVGKRTVYKKSEIEKLSKKPTLVILFNWHFYLKKPVPLSALKQNGILKGAPQSIVEIPDEKYRLLITEGGIDESFTVH